LKEIKNGRNYRFSQVAGKQWYWRFGNNVDFYIEFKLHLKFYKIFALKKVDKIRCEMHA